MQYNLDSADKFVAWLKSLGYEQVKLKFAVGVITKYDGGHPLLLLFTDGDWAIAELGLSRMVDTEFNSTYEAMPDWWMW